MTQSILTIPIPLLPPEPAPEMTYEAFLNWNSEAGQHYEWAEGEAVWMGTVSSEHNEIGSFLLTVIREYVLTRNLGIVRYDPFSMKTAPHLPGRNPDILFLATTNLSRLKNNYLEGPADLAVEIVSPESRHRDYHTKFAEYAQGGVQEYWLIDPETKQTAFYLRNEVGQYEPMVVEEGVFRSGIMEGFWMKVEWLWERPSLRTVLQTWEQE